MFGWNDPAGTMLAAHGFALHDRQTTLFGRVGAPQTDPETPKKELFHEIDDRPGYYVGAQARYLDRAVLNVLHYDNRADPAVGSCRDSRLRLADEIRCRGIAHRNRQWLDACSCRRSMATRTSIPCGSWLDWEFDSQSALLAKRVGAHMLAARYDAFEVVKFDGDPTAAGSEDGHAWTLAYSFDRGEHWRFALEWLRVDERRAGAGGIAR